MARGFVYLAVVLDWFSRRVLSWRISITMEVDFCLEAVEEALARQGRPEIFNFAFGMNSPQLAACFWSAALLPQYPAACCGDFYLLVSFQPGT
jgi:transposase InsO family protein